MNFLFALRTKKVKHIYSMLEEENPSKIVMGRIYFSDMKNAPQSPLDALYRNREDGHFSEGEGVIFA